MKVKKNKNEQDEDEKKPPAVLPQGEVKNQAEL